MDILSVFLLLKIELRLIIFGDNKTTAQL